MVQRFPENSSPYQSTVVFIVRKGNPKQILNWGDLATKDVQIITPDQKTSGGAQLELFGRLGCTHFARPWASCPTLKR